MSVNEYHNGLMQRIKWADKNYDLVVNTYVSTILQDPSLQTDIDQFNAIRERYVRGAIFSSADQFSAHTLLNKLGVPKCTMVDGGLPNMKKLEVRGQAFADTVYQLKASVECTGIVEAKIQDTLTQYEVSMEWDRYNVSGHGNAWIAIIHRVNSYEDDIENLIEGGRDMIESYKRLYQKAADGELWIGFGSPEVALTSAMVDFRRDQLRLLGLYA